MKKNLTELVFIVDRSGSMSGLESDTIGGLNATLDRHRAVEGEVIVSTVLFSHRTRVLHDRVPLDKVEPLSKADYRAYGNTALLDAVGGSIRHIERVQRYLPEEHRAEHVIFVIITDGMENSSRRYTCQQVRELIEQKERDGWEFLFLGANFNAEEEASRLGIAADRAVTYLADKLGTRIMHESIADATCSMRYAARRVDDSWKRSVERDAAKRSRR